MEYYEIYLHIIEANNIKGVEKNGKSDPYVRVMVPNEKGKLKEFFRTREYQNTVNPVFHDETLMTVPCYVENIVLQLKDWNQYLKDKKLGHVILPLNKIPNQPCVEFHPIEGGGVLKMCARLLRVAPVIPDFHDPVEDLSSRRFHIEQRIYHPGEVVRGYVVFNWPGMPHEGEKGSVEFRARCYKHKIQYLDIHEEFHTTQASLGLWVFQFAIPKRIPTVDKVDGYGFHSSITLSVYSSMIRSEFSTDIMVMPPLDGLEPKLSPRRPERNIVAPSSLLVNWVDLPRILYQERTNTIKIKLHNSGTQIADFKCLVNFRFQQIITEAEPKMRDGMISKETIGKINTEDLGTIQLGPSESREISFVLNHKDINSRHPPPPSAPFEVSGDVHERNYFLEVEIQPPSGAPIVISRKPFFWTFESVTRTTPPNYQQTVEPETFWVTTLADPEVIYPLLAPSAVWRSKVFLRDIDTFSDPIPTPIFDTLGRETMTRLPNRIEDLPLLKSIFDIPFDDAC